MNSEIFFCQTKNISTVSVAEVALTKVHFTTQKKKEGGKRIVALAIRTQLRGHSQSKYAELGADPRALGAGTWEGEGEENNATGRARRGGVRGRTAGGVRGGV